jgi:hypothetical protein
MMYELHTRYDLKIAQPANNLFLQLLARVWSHMSVNGCNESAQCRFALAARQ